MRKGRSLIRKRREKVGLPPGTLVHLGEKRTEKPLITLINFNESTLDIREVASAEECAPFLSEDTVTWINVDGLHQTDLVEKFGAFFQVHPLALEDILNTDHRPKMEDYDAYVFLVLKMLFYEEAEGEVQAEQVSLILGQNYVLSFQEQRGDVFDGIRERLRTNKGRLRKSGPDYLAYALLDAIVDSYFGILEKISDQIEVMEEALVFDPTPGTLQRIHHFKREMILLRKSVWPLREVISGLQREDTPLVGKTTGIFLRDVYDHTIQVVDTVETFRDIISGMLDLYLSSMSNRMNEIMKVLTIMATIFIPLTFIVGVYGMNFAYMPELKWHWGYFGIWGIMVGIAVVMIFFFKRKKWL
jgi:magnesium transporter